MYKYLVSIVVLGLAGLQTFACNTATAVSYYQNPVAVAAVQTYYQVVQPTQIVYPATVSYSAEVVTPQVEKIEAPVPTVEATPVVPYTTVQAGAYYAGYANVAAVMAHCYHHQVAAVINAHNYGHTVAFVKLHGNEVVQVHEHGVNVAVRTGNEVVQVKEVKARKAARQARRAGREAGRKNARAIKKGK